MMIDWEAVDILTCLEVEPIVDKERTSYRYTFVRDGLLTALEIWPYDSDVWLGIRLADHDRSLIDLRMRGCREIRCIREADREELYFTSHDSSSHYRANILEGWRLQITPHIEVKMGQALAP